MLDNLALDLADSTVQANLNSSTTNATDESISYLKGINTRNPLSCMVEQFAKFGANCSVKWVV